MSAGDLRHAVQSTTRLLTRRSAPWQVQPPVGPQRPSFAAILVGLIRTTDDQPFLQTD
jgi:hypothetical protein